MLAVIFNKLLEWLMVSEDDDFLACMLCQLRPQPFSLDLVLLNSSVPLEPRNIAVVIHATDAVVYHIVASKGRPHCASKESIVTIFMLTIFMAIVW